MRAFPCHQGEMIYDLFSNNSQPALCTGPSCQQSVGTSIPLHLPSHIHSSFLLPLSSPIGKSVSTDTNTAYLYMCSLCLVIGTGEVAKLQTHE